MWMARHRVRPVGSLVAQKSSSSSRSERLARALSSWRRRDLRTAKPVAVSKQANLESAKIHSVSSNVVGSLSEMEPRPFAKAEHPATRATSSRTSHLRSHELPTTEAEVQTSSHHSSQRVKLSPPTYYYAGVGTTIASPVVSSVYCVAECHILMRQQIKTTVSTTASSLSQPPASQPDGRAEALNTEPRLPEGMWAIVICMD